MINKTVRSMAEAMEGIKDGSIVLLGGFAGVGDAPHLMDGLIEQGAKELTMVANTVGGGELGLSKLIGLGRVRKLIVSWARSRLGGHFEDLYKDGKIELELTPQGTLAERMRAAGAGVPAFYTPASVGTPLAHGKEHREIDGRIYVLEKAIKGDVALVEAWQADRWGNLVYRASGRNFNPNAAAAAELTIVQTQHLVPLGDIPPDQIHTPGIFVNRVLHLPYGNPAF